METFLGIDYGTTGLKVCLFDAHGTIVAQAIEEIPITSPRTGWVEQDMELGWERTCHAIRTTLALANISEVAVKAVGVTGTLNQTIFDGNGQVLRSAILYGDQRLPSKSEIQLIHQEIGPVRLASVFGLEEYDEGTLTMILRVLRLPKLLWLRSHEPDLFERVATCITSSWDFMIFRLTGEVTHWADGLELDLQIADLFSIPRTWFGKACLVGDVVGLVNAEGSAASGLPEGVPVVMGATDSSCALLGAGLVREGMVLNAAGTTDVVAVALNERPRCDIGYPVRHLISKMWLLFLSPVRGPILRWYLDLFLSEGATYADMDLLAAAVPPGSRGLLCLPYFLGEKGVVHDPLARGMFLGLDVQHDRRHFARAILESMAYSVREILDAYADCGIPLTSIHLSGGGARSEVWNQIKADVLAQPLNLLQVLETGCLGAAVLAAVALNFYPDRLSGAASMTRVVRVVEPIEKNSRIYEDAYRQYCQLYACNQPIFAELGLLRSNG